MTIANRKSQIANPRSAFTLIEILLAIGILAIGITSVMFLFAMGARSHRRAVDRTRAALLADAVVNQIRADLAVSMPERYTVNADKTIESIVDVTHADYPEFTYTVIFNKLYPSGDPQGAFYKVRVIIRWGDPSLERTERNSEVYETILRRKNT